MHGFEQAPQIPRVPEHTHTESDASGRVDTFKNSVQVMAGGLSLSFATPGGCVEVGLRSNADGEPPGQLWWPSHALVAPSSS